MSKNRKMVAGFLVVAVVLLVGYAIVLQSRSQSGSVAPGGGGPRLRISLRATKSGDEALKPGVATLFINETQIKTYNVAADSVVADNLSLEGLYPVNQVTFVRQDGESSGKMAIDKLELDGIDIKPGLYRVSPSGGNAYLDDSSRSGWVREGSMTWHPAVYRWNSMGVPRFK